MRSSDKWHLYKRRGHKTQKFRKEVRGNRGRGWLGPDWGMLEATGSAKMQGRILPPKPSEGI